MTEPNMELEGVSEKILAVLAARFDRSFSVDDYIELVDKAIQEAEQRGYEKGVEAGRDEEKRSVFQHKVRITDAICKELDIENDSIYEEHLAEKAVNAIREKEKKAYEKGAAEEVECVCVGCKQIRSEYCANHSIEIL